MATTGYILASQQAPYPSWVPFLGEDTFELKADLETAQAITPGQGQTVNVAGIKVGDITEVNLDDGHAVVTMLLEDRYKGLIKDDATVLVRPRTGLQDMTLEVDPGSPDAPAMEEDDIVPLASTQRNVHSGRVLGGARRRHPRLPQAARPGRLGGPRRERRDSVSGLPALLAAFEVPGDLERGPVEAKRRDQARRSPRSRKSLKPSADPTRARGFRVVLERSPLGIR